MSNVVEQWVLKYDSGIWDGAYIRTSKEFGVSGVRGLSRATIFSNEAKKKTEEEIFALCKERGFKGLQWSAISVTPVNEYEKLRGALEWLYESTLEFTRSEPVALEDVLVHAKVILEKTKTDEF